MPTPDATILNDKKELSVVEHEGSQSAEESAYAALDSIEQTKSSAYVWLIASWAAIGGLLFGYDTGVISAVLVVIGDDLGKPLTSNDSEMITSLTSGGAFVGAVIAGLLADRHGRKICIMISAILFTVGSVVMASAFSLPQMCVGRFVIGLGVGTAAMVVPVFNGELSPARYRGRMIALDVCSITGGQCVAYLLGTGLQHAAAGWRWMVAIGAVPSILLGVLLFWVPESPRQLIYHNRPSEAREVLKKIYPEGTDQQLDDKVRLLTQTLHEYVPNQADYGIWKALVQLNTIPENLRAITAACGLMGLQQLCGFNTLMYYSATLFKMVGFKDPVATGIVVAGTNFLFCCVGLLCIDKLGRRRLLIVTVWIMALALAAAAISFHWIPINQATLTVTTSKFGWPEIVMLVSLIIFVAAYGAALAPVGWQGAEFLPMEVRATGTMLITCTCWGTNIIVSSTFLSMMKGITPSGTFGFYSTLCAIGWVLVIFLYPEVAQMPLEEVRAVFQHGFGVRYARKWQKAHKQALKEKRLAAEGDK